MMMDKQGSVEISYDTINMGDTGPSSMPMIACTLLSNGAKYQELVNADGDSRRDCRCR